MGNFFSSMFDTDYITDPADLFGRRQADKDYRRAEKNTKEAIAMAKGVNNAATTQSNKALLDMAYYDAITKENVGTSAADYLAKQQAAASGMSELTGQTAANQGSRQAIKAARTSGLSKGQSALVAAQGAGDIYSNAYLNSLDTNKNQYNTAVGTQAGLAQDMSSRNVNAMNTRIAAAGIPMGIGQNQASAAATKQAGSQAALGAVAGGVATMMSDKNAKEDIKEINKSNKFNYDNAKNSLDVIDIAKLIKPVAFKYKKEVIDEGKAKEGEHVGVIAQDLENTPLQEAVITGDDGLKRIDTAELTPAVLNLIIQLARKVDDLEKGRK